MNALAIAGIGIRQDEAGRYSLNDLHRAAGGEHRHRPAYWLENNQTRELVGELEKAGIPAIDARQRVGTFVAKELVYAYAMWISPAFHLQVIRAYDAAVSRPAPLAALSDPAALRELLLGYAERTLALEHQVAEQAPKIEALERIASARGAVCLTDAAKLLQMRPSDLISWMQEHSWIYKRPGTSWLPYQPRVHTGMLTLKLVERGSGGEARVYDQVKVTPKGLAKLGELLAVGRERLAG